MAKNKRKLENYKRKKRLTTKACRRRTLKAHAQRQSQREEKAKLQAIAGNCLLCSSPHIICPTFQNPSDKTSTWQTSTLAVGTNVLFLLKKLLHLPDSQCEEHLTNHGDPATWIALCYPCSTVVQRAYELYSHIQRLKAEFQSLGRTLRNGFHVKREVILDNTDCDAGFGEGEQGQNVDESQQQDGLVDGSTAADKIRAFLVSQSSTLEPEPDHFPILDGTLNERFQPPAADGQCNSSLKLKTNPKNREPVKRLNSSKKRSSRVQDMAESENVADEPKEFDQGQVPKRPRLRTRGSSNKGRPLIPTTPKPKDVKNETLSTAEFVDPLQKLEIKMENLDEVELEELDCVDIFPMMGEEILPEESHQPHEMEDPIPHASHVEEDSDDPPELASDSEYHASEVDAALTDSSSSSAAGKKNFKTKNIAKNRRAVMKSETSDISNEEDGDNDEYEPKPNPKRSRPKTSTKSKRQIMADDKAYSKIKVPVKPSWVWADFVAWRKSLLPGRQNINSTEQRSSPTTRLPPLQWLAEKFKIDQFPCPGCKSIFSSYPDLRKHGPGRCIRCDVFKCWFDACDFNPHNSPALENHIRSEHQSKEDVTCTGCGLCFPILQDFNEHIKQSSKAEGHQETNVKCIEKALTCSKCCDMRLENYFSNPSVLDLHTRVKHRPAEELPFVCTVAECGKRFTLHSSLRRHEEHVHNSTERTWICDQCGASFKNYSNMDAHIQMVHRVRLPGAERFTCEICGKQMVSQVRLNRHKQIHIAPENAPHLCTLCGKRFRLRDYLNIHMRSHDPDRRLKYPHYMSKKNRGPADPGKRGVAGAKIGRPPVNPPDPVSSSRSTKVASKRGRKKKEQHQEETSHEQVDSSLNSVTNSMEYSAPTSESFDPSGTTHSQLQEPQFNFNQGFTSGNAQLQFGYQFPFPYPGLPPRF